LIGGAQDAMTTGTVISKQCWDFEEAELDVEHTYEEELEGRLLETIERSTEKRVLVDRPVCKLIPIENLRLDPAADWIDPINTSPYLIELQPTYVYQVRKKMKQGKYREVPVSFFAAAVHQDWDSIRKAREGGVRLDKYDNDAHISDFQSLWVHHHIMHVDGQDWVYDTLGTEVLLMDPVPIEDYYAHSRTYKRPYKMGCAVIEAHKNYPGGIPQLIEDLQEEANDIANLRIDNIRHYLNPRWLVRRGSGVDIRSLMRNVASGVTYVSNTSNDVKEVRAQDVTASSFQEQDRLNLDMDDLVGTFSGSSVQANRKLNETVGGMNLLSADSSRLEEYLIRTVSETWVEHVMQDFVDMEAAYESDEKILQVVADRLRTDIATVLDVLTEPVNVRCNVGFNATNPQKRIEKMALGLATVNAYSPATVMGLDPRELVKEVFGSLGYKDGSRFFPALHDHEVDPRIQQLEQQVAQLTQALETESYKEQTKLHVAAMARDTKLADIETHREIEILKLQADAVAQALQSRIDQIDAQLRIEESDRKRRELFLAREALSHEIQESNRNFQLELAKLRQTERQNQRELMAPRGGKSDGKSGKSVPAPKKPNGSGGMAGVIARDRFGMVPGKMDGLSPP
jgi:hypothetical protein